MVVVVVVATRLRLQHAMTTKLLLLSGHLPAAQFEFAEKPKASPGQRWNLLECSSPWNHASPNLHHTAKPCWRGPSSHQRSNTIRETESNCILYILHSTVRCKSAREHLHTSAKIVSVNPSKPSHPRTAWKAWPVAVLAWQHRLHLDTVLYTYCMYVRWRPSIPTFSFNDLVNGT